MIPHITGHPSYLGWAPRVEGRHDQSPCVQNYVYKSTYKYNVGNMFHQLSCTHIRMYTCTHTHTHTRARTRTHTHMRTHTHTHAHTHRPSFRTQPTKPQDEFKHTSRDQHECRRRGRRGGEEEGEEMNRWSHPALPSLPNLRPVPLWSHRPPSSRQSPPLRAHLSTPPSAEHKTSPPQQESLPLTWLETC